jgi:nicotinate-nucleotide adenylyltransferase
LAVRIGLYFGSFNPIHLGHLIIANTVGESADLKKIWFVLSPQNPLKEKKTLLPEYDRLHLLNLAIEDNPQFQASTIEFDLPQPSYTIDTLAYLKEKYPSHEFVLIMGGDQLPNLHKWKNYQKLISENEIIIYKRSDEDQLPLEWKSLAKNVTLLDVPLFPISSTMIRQKVKAKKSIHYLVPEKVEQYILSSGYYK